MQLVEYGTTTEGRPLIYAVFASPANLARIDELRTSNLSLRSASTSPQSVTSVLRETPPVVWLAYGIHGNESSSPEAAMVVAGRLASGELDDVLEELIVIVDPSQNPDGLQRYVGWYVQKRGVEPDPRRAAMEHREPWPGGRYNHYMFDMNRDWAWTSQHESRLRVAAFRRWEPRVFVDLHEMGFNSSYFFPPEASPVNANVPQGTLALLELFGRENAEAFTAQRWPFFVGERFDLFYPGYGDAWPSLRGAVGMTYEVAGGGAAGLAVRREDGTVLTLTDRVARHVLASVTTLTTAAANSETLQRHARASFEDQMAAPVTTWILDHESSNADELVQMLLRQGIEVSRLESDVRVAAREHRTGLRREESFAAGSWAVSSAQPLGALARTLLELDPDLDPAFVSAQRARIESDENDQFYDITVWSLPVAMNVDAWEVSGRVPSTSIVTSIDGSDSTVPPSGFAWLVRPDQKDFDRFVARAMDAGLAMRIAAVPLRRSGGETLPAGALVIPSTEANAAKIPTVLSGLATRLIAADEVWDGGTPLGSDDIRAVQEARIALVAGEGFDPRSFGSLWHTLDADLGMPHSVVEISTLDERVMDEFNVIVLPGSRIDLEKTIGKSGIEALQRWVKAGGILVAIGGSAAALRSEAVALSKVEERKPEPSEDGEDAPEENRRFRIPGSAFRTEVDRSSFLAWGIAGEPAVILEGNDFLAAPEGAQAVVTVTDAEPLIAGFMWPESSERVQGAAWLVEEDQGSGLVITFADDPFFRSFWRGTLQYFVNAIAWGPTMAR